MPIIEGPPSPDDPPRPLHIRLLWFAILWIGSASAVAAGAYCLRALIVQ